MLRYICTQEKNRFFSILQIASMHVKNKKKKGNWQPFYYAFTCIFGILNLILSPIADDDGDGNLYQRQQLQQQ